MIRFGPGFFAQNKRGMLMAGLGLAFGGVGFVGLLFGGITTVIKSSWAYSTAVPRAVADPRVQQALGAPVVPGWILTGSVNTDGYQGHAELSVPLEGAAGKGQLEIRAHATEDVWELDRLRVQIQGGQAIDLLAP